MTNEEAREQALRQWGPEAVAQDGLGLRGPYENTTMMSRYWIKTKPEGGYLGYGDTWEEAFAQVAKAEKVWAPWVRTGKEGPFEVAYRKGEWTIGREHDLVYWHLYDGEGAHRYSDESLAAVQAYAAAEDAK